MADILIKGLKLPEWANELRLIIHPNGQVLIVKQTYWEETEAIEVPDHGRLIDANKLKDTLDYYIREAGWGDEINKALGWVKDEFIDSEPTVIPASEEET